MTLQDIADYRLTLQQLVSSRFTNPHDLVSYMGAVQAQDYLSAQWALGMRMKDAQAHDIDQALEDGSIIRTHAMRPTWHFVAPEDLRWIQQLTSDRVRPTLAYYNRQLGLTDTIHEKTRRILQEILSNHTYLTRDEIKKVFESEHISIPTGQFMAHIMFDAELESVVCSGPRRGKQFTYALVDERIKPTPLLSRDEALTAIAKRYFTSHGPASLKDFVWWSALKIADGKRGIALLENELRKETISGVDFYYMHPLPTSHMPKLHVSLQPAYDEYTIAYQHHEVHFPKVFSRKDVGYGYFILINGQISGIWQRTIKPKVVAITINPFRGLSTEEKKEIKTQAERYSEFIGLPITIRPL